MGVERRLLKPRSSGAERVRGGQVFLGLDPDTKYCLVDTMVLLPVYYEDPDMARDVRSLLGGATLVLLSKVVGEAYFKCRDVEDVGGTYEDFASTLAGRLDSAGMASVLVWFEDEMLEFWNGVMGERTHPNLSGVDYALLCASVRRPDMDVMTGDKGLAGSIRRERGRGSRGRILAVMSGYTGRRNHTVRLIRRRLGDYLPADARLGWSTLGRCTRFNVDGCMIASADAAGRSNVQVDLSRLVDDRERRGALESELGREIGESFRGWKPDRRKKDIRGKDWYRQHRDDDAAMR